MKKHRLSIWLLAVTALTLGMQNAVAAEIKVLSAVLMRSALEELSVTFERATGYKVILSFGTATTVPDRIRQGESGDLVIVPLPAMESLQKEGKALDSSTVGRSLVAVSTRAGAAKPDISTVDLLKRSLLAARSIAYSDPAGGANSGVHFAAVLERLGIADEIKSKTKLTRVPGPGPTDLVVSGEVELGISQPADILSVPGAELAGPLPAELQNTREFVYQAAVLPTATDSTAARAFVQFLLGSEAAAVMKKKGLEPG
jgi:molybdate transport system substrate-binding protein